MEFGILCLCTLAAFFVVNVFKALFVLDGFHWWWRTSREGQGIREREFLRSHASGYVAPTSDKWTLREAA